MHTDTQSNALAEIGLALAMALFSIMILTLVSMGAGNAPSKPANAAAADALSLRAAAKSESQAGSGAVQTASPENIVIYYAGQYYDAKLKAITADSLAGKAEVVLAVDPKLSITDGLRAQRGIGAEKLTITTLNETWLKALQEQIK
jgi:hypothetical protein